MPVQTARPDAIVTLHPGSVNGAAHPAAAVAAAPASRRARMPARISRLQAALIGAALALTVLVIFIIQNAHVVQVSFLGIDVRLSLAVALLLTLFAGAVLMTFVAVAVLMTAAGTARIIQLRRAVGRTLAVPPPAPVRTRRIAPPR